MLALAITISSCVYIDVDTSSGYKPAISHEEADDLKGAFSKDLVVEAENTLLDVVFRTSLVMLSDQAVHQDPRAACKMQKGRVRIQRFPVLAAPNAY